MKKSDNPFAQIMDGILGSVAKETRDDYAKEIDVLGKIKDSEDYSMYVSYPLRNVLDETIRRRLTPQSHKEAVHKVSFLYENHHFVENHLEFFIVKKEGTACSADKSRYIMRAYERYYIEGKPLALPYSEEDEKNKCYWKPHFWTDEIWLELLESLVSLYYGNVTKYLLFMKDNFVEKEKDNA